jgi:hypothetical protein
VNHQLVEGDRPRNLAWELDATRAGHARPGVGIAPRLRQGEQVAGDSCAPVGAKPRGITRSGALERRLGRGRGEGERHAPEVIEQITDRERLARRSPVERVVRHPPIRPARRRAAGSRSTGRVMAPMMVWHGRALPELLFMTRVITSNECQLAHSLMLAQGRAVGVEMGHEGAASSGEVGDGRGHHAEGRSCCRLRATRGSRTSSLGYGGQMPPERDRSLQAVSRVIFHVPSTNTA